MKKMLHDRFEIDAGTVVTDKFFIFDHHEKRNDLIRDRNGTTKYFDTVQEATDYINEGLSKGKFQVAR